jgi:hypothetical protein
MKENEKGKEDRCEGKKSRQRKHTGAAVVFLELPATPSGSDDARSLVLNPTSSREKRLPVSTSPSIPLGIRAAIRVGALSHGRDMLDW